MRRRSFMPKVKIAMLVCGLVFCGYLMVQLAGMRMGIGERAMGGYDGASTLSPEAVGQAKREARDAADRAEAAARALQRDD